VKTLNVSEELAQKAAQALDEVEMGVLGKKTGVKAGAGTPGCKPWLCPQPLYGVPPI